MGGDMKTEAGNLLQNSTKNAPYLRRKLFDTYSNLQVSHLNPGRCSTGRRLRKSEMRLSWPSLFLYGKWRRTVNSRCRRRWILSEWLMTVIRFEELVSIAYVSVVARRHTTAALDSSENKRRTIKSNQFAVFNRRIKTHIGKVNLLKLARQKG